MLLSCLVFAGFVLSQVAAVVAVHAERKNRHPDAFDAGPFDHLTRLIRNSGG